MRVGLFEIFHRKILPWHFTFHLKILMMKKCLCLHSFALLLLFFLVSCGQKSPQEPQASTYKTIGKIERFSSELDAILAGDAKIEVLAEGYNWTEGPIWVADGGYLLFSDVPENTIFKWKEGEGASVYLKPSGFTGQTTESKEPGSNGLTLDADGKLVLCQHGDRRVARMTAPLSEPKPEFEMVADNWAGKIFNSPNDLCYDSQRNLYFTDPPYGLPHQMEDPTKEIPFQGVFRRNKDGAVDVLIDSLTRPNGIALSPDEKTLYVANSDPEWAVWMAYDISEDGKLVNGRTFFDATSLVSDQNKGLPDGMKVNKNGILFATGPSGVWIFKPDGTVLGKINPGEATANCAFGSDGKYLYLTADMYLCRVGLVN